MFLCFALVPKLVQRTVDFHGYRYRILKFWYRDNTNRKAYCSVCKKNINVNWMGANALRSHIKSTKHKNGMRARREQLILPISAVCAAAPPPPLPQIRGAVFESATVHRIRNSSQKMPVCNASTCNECQPVCWNYTFSPLQILCSLFYFIY